MKSYVVERYLHRPYAFFIKTTNTHHIYLATRHTIELSKAMADAGADALLVVTPCYYKGRMTNQALIEHYSKVK